MKMKMMKLLLVVVALAMAMFNTMDVEALTIPTSNLRVSLELDKGLDLEVIEDVEEEDAMWNDIQADLDNVSMEFNSWTMDEVEDESHDEHPPHPGPPGPPPISDVIRSARYLVSRTNFGFISTNGKHGVPFGNVASFSDGAGSSSQASNSTGIPYFMLTTMDPTAQFLEKDSRASFTISAKTNRLDGGCHGLDAQEPPCARITLMGHIVRVKCPIEAARGRAALISKHPAMAHWPKHHGFAIYKMQIHAIFFLNNYGGAKTVNVKKYLAVKLRD